MRPDQYTPFAPMPLDAAEAQPPPRWPQEVQAAVAQEKAYRESLERFRASQAATAPPELDEDVRLVEPFDVDEVLGPPLRSNEYPDGTDLRLCPGCGYMQPFAREESTVCIHCEKEGKSDDA